MFQVATATTDPPETQTYTETQSTVNNQPQTVGQTEHSGTYPAWSIGQYGCPPWYMSWLPQQTTYINTLNGNPGNMELHADSFWGNYGKTGGNTASGGYVVRFEDGTTYYRGAKDRRIDFGTSIDKNLISSIIFKAAISSYHGSTAGLRIEFYVSDNGNDWHDVGFAIGSYGNPATLKITNYNIPIQTVRYVRATTDDWEKQGLDDFWIGNPNRDFWAVDDPSQNWIGLEEYNNVWSDTNAYWIWGGKQNYTSSAINGQEVTLTKYFWADNANYTVSAVTDDHFSAYIDSTNILNGDGPTVKRWNWTTGGAGWHMVTIHARNDYGPAGVLFSIQKDSDSSILLHSDSSWSYQPVDGIKYGNVTLPTNVAPDTDFTVSVPVTNLTQATWSANSTYISYHWYDSNGNLVVTNGNIAHFHNDLASGASDTVSLTVHTPSTPGKYRLQIDGYQSDAATWFGSINGINGVNWPTVDATINVGSTYGVDYSPVSIPKYMEKGKTYNITVTAKNMGTTTWTPGDTGLSYHLYNASGNQCILWDGTRTYVTQPVPPGQSYTFNLSFTAPNTAGTYQIQLDMIKENVCWFSQQGSPTVWGTIQVPDGDVLKGQLTYDGSDYWVNGYILQTSRDLSGYVGKNVILWGQSGGQEKIYIVTDIQPYDININAVKTFDPILDVYCNDPNASDPDHPSDTTVNYKRTDGYAYCRVTYHFPTPLTDFWKYVFNRRMWYRAEPLFINESGESFFSSNETGGE
jgi:hypothetical protein